MRWSKHLARAQSPLLASIKAERAETIPVSKITGRDGRELEILPMSFSVSMEVDIDGAVAGDLSGLFEALDLAGEQEARALTRVFISTLSDVTDLTGNKVDAGGRPLSWDLITDAFEKIEIEFDEHGGTGLSLMLHPDTYARLAALGPPTAEQQARHDAVLARKRAEWEARRRPRRLRREDG